VHGVLARRAGILSTIIRRRDPADARGGAERPDHLLPPADTRARRGAVQFSNTATAMPHIANFKPNLSSMCWCVIIGKQRGDEPAACLRGSRAGDSCQERHHFMVRRAGAETHEHSDRLEATSASINHDLRPSLIITRDQELQKPRRAGNVWKIEGTGWRDDCNRAGVHLGAARLGAPRWLQSLSGARSMIRASRMAARVGGRGPGFQSASAVGLPSFWDALVRCATKRNARECLSRLSPTATSIVCVPSEDSRHGLIGKEKDGGRS